MSVRGGGGGARETGCWINRQSKSCSTSSTTVAARVVTCHGKAVAPLSLSVSVSAWQARLRLWPLVGLAHKGLLVVYSFIKLKCKYNLPLKININWCTSSRGKWSNKDKGRRQQGGYLAWREREGEEEDSGKAGWQAGNRFAFKSHFQQFTTKTKTHRE